MAIDQYMMSVRTRLSAISPETAETIEELRAHLEDTAGDLQLAGLAPGASEREAVRRCGAPDVVARAITDERKAGGSAWPRQGRRSLAAALVVAASLAAIGGSAVASAYTTPAHASIRHSSMSGSQPARLALRLHINTGGQHGD